MKILMITDKMDFGGAETHIFTLACSLKKRGHRVLVVSSGGELANRLEKCGICHIRAPLDRRSFFCMLRSCRLLKGLIKNGGFHIVHSHARLPSYIANRIARAHDVCFVTTVHASFALKGFRRGMSRWGEKTIAVSQDLKQYLCRSYLIPPENIRVIGNGIDTQSFCIQKPTQKRLHTVKKDFLRIAFLSRLDSDCSLGAELLCLCAKELYDCLGYFEIIIGGMGDDYNRIKELARGINKELGFKCIRLLGRVRDVPSFLNSADAFVGVSRAAIEASLKAIPVVLCGNEGFLGWLTLENLSKAERSNFCCRGEGRATREGLLFELKRAIWGRLEAERLQRIFSQRYSAEKMAEQTEDFYKKAIENRPQKNTDVLLCGYYGFGNMGDDVLLRSAIIRAREELGAVGICALTKGGRKDSIIFGVRCVKRKDPIGVIREISRCKYFIFGGGTVLQSVSSKRSLFYYCGILRLARLFGADCRLWGNGIGDIESRMSARLIKRALETCSYIGLRDECSYKRAEALLEGGQGLVFENDLSELYGASSRERIDFLMEELFGVKDKISDFIIVALKGKSEHEKIKERLDEAKEKGMLLLFVVMHEKEDGEASEELCREYGGVMARGLDFCDLVGIAGYSKGVYSMRLHALIAAKRAGVGYEGFGNDGKIKDFCR